MIETHEDRLTDDLFRAEEYFEKLPDKIIEKDQVIEQLNEALRAARAMIERA